MITEPIALDKSLNTTGTSSKNIADVVQKGLNDIRNAIEGGSGGGGHIIVDQSGAEMPQEPNMTFKDAHLTDNPTGESTDIEIVKEVLPADYASTTDEGIIVTDDGNDALIGAVSDDKVEVTADGNTTWIDILNYIFNHTDLSKITPNANLCVAGTYHPLVTKTNVLLAFAKTRSISSTQVETSTFVLQASNSHCDDCSLTSGSPASASITDNSANKPSNGAVITLYYGNKKATVDLQTTANRCLMADGVTSVESAIDKLNPSALTYIADGEKTYRQCLVSLKTKIDTSKINYRSVILIDGAVHKCVDTSLLRFSRTYATTVGLMTYSPFLTGACSYIESVGTTCNDNSNEIPSNGTVFAFYYN